MIKSNACRYSTRVSNSGKVGCFLEQINITRGKLLTLVGLDTGSLQDSMLTRSTNGLKNSQLNWLTQTLEETTDNWLIISGYHPVVICDKEQVEAKQIYVPLHNIFMKYGVVRSEWSSHFDIYGGISHVYSFKILNAYMSRQGCNSHPVQGGVAYIGIADPTESEPLNSLNERLAFRK
ncbi:unnamed protein product [Dovyalis caffra]|uniref:Uncharacterized protein n=1 Tax=Dovyalis caffra TaxID=77055 RepID=A0AAV1RRX9_9ROSI|nr:unnamed protein product [Dovyalis caffra]